MADWFPFPQHLNEPHPGHEAHLCMAENLGFVKSNLEDYKKYVITVEGAELARGGGGCRCMTMPVCRKDI